MSSSEGTQALAAPSTTARSPYIANRWFDWVFFLLPPLAALGLGILISGSHFSNDKFPFGAHNTTLASLAIGTLINAHLVAVFFRSHLNPGVFKRHPIRFIVTPPLLFAAMMLSDWVLVSVTVLTVFWDVYHSSLQTFGFGRIYDRNCGNDPKVGRRLDWGLNLLLYAGPIVAGATMLAHFQRFELFEDVDADYLAEIPVFMAQNQPYFARAIVLAGSLFLMVYLLSYWRFYRKGYKISLLKVFLLVTTGFCSIYSWGFNTWGEAFFIMNFFHAVQYLGLVWWSENKYVRSRLRLNGAPVALFVFLGSVTAYGFWSETVEADATAAFAIVQVIAIMHFWYDGFIWSVRKQQI